MTTQKNKSRVDVRDMLAVYGVYIALVAPVIVGIFWQSIMWFGDVEALVVPLTPPGELRPLISVEVSWWFLMFILSSGSCFLVMRDYIREFPKRGIIPVYGYLLFLLFLVKPV